MKNNDKKYTGTGLKRIPFCCYFSEEGTLSIMSAKEGGLIKVNLEFLKKIFVG